MRKSVNYFVYFVVALYTVADIRTSLGQWESCEKNTKLTNSAIWKCVKKTKCVHTKDLPPKLTVICGQDELCCPELRVSKPSVRNSTTSKLPVTPTKPPAPPSNAFTRANEIALNMCNQYLQYRYLNYTVESPFVGDPDIPKSMLNCTTIESLILGGEPAELTEYPHMALLGYDNDVTQLEEWRCGGSLVSERFILSAAHCSKTKGGENVKWAALGLLSRTDITTDSIDRNVFRIIQAINHPEYRTGSAYHDIALYKLKSAIKPGPVIRPICIHHLGTTKTNTPASVTGWGKIVAGGIESEPLLKATIQNLDTNICVRVYKDDASLRKGFNATTMICGGDLEGKNDTCNGDSGGPMQILMPRERCMWIQTGITSQGPIYCGAMPAIYTRVSYYLPWIQQIVWPSAISG